MSIITQRFPATDMTYIRMTDNYYAHGSDPTMLLKNYVGGTDHCIPIIRFNLANPQFSDDKIASVRLAVYISSSDVGLTVQTYSVYKPWTAAFAAWITYADGMAWSSAGAYAASDSYDPGSYDRRATSLGDLSYTAGAPGWYYVTYSVAALNLLRGQQSSVLIKDNEVNGFSWETVISKSAGQQPYIEVTYNAGAGGIIMF